MGKADLAEAEVRQDRLDIQGDDRLVLDDQNPRRAARFRHESPGPKAVYLDAMSTSRPTEWFPRCYAHSAFPTMGWPWARGNNHRRGSGPAGTGVRPIRSSGCCP